jgi:hypothetical protein
VLYRLPAHRYGFDPVLIDPTGTALLWQTSNARDRQATTDIWVHGTVHKIYGNTLSRRIQPEIW